MTKINKLIIRFQNKPKNFTWNELVRLLNHFGYDEIRGIGSRRKFINDKHQCIVLHEPHPRKVLKMYQINQILTILIEENLL